MKDIVEIGPLAIPPLLDAYKKSYEKPRTSVLRGAITYILIQIGLKNKETMCMVLSSLPEENDELKLDFFIMVQREPSKSIPILLEVLKEDNAYARLYTLKILEDRPISELTDSIPTFIDILKDKRLLQIGFLSARILAKIGKKAIPYLHKALKNRENSTMRYKAASTLGMMGKKAKDSIPLLIEALSDEDWFVRRTAVLALGEIGIKSKKTIAALLSLKETDPHEEVKNAAKSAILKLTSD